MPAMFIQNFTCANQTANAAVGTSASGGALLLTTAQTASQQSIQGGQNQFPDVFVVNYGTSGAQVAFGTSSGVTAINTAAVVAANPATGSTQVYIPPGMGMVVSRNGNTYWSAITDSGSASLILMTGSGS